MVSLPCKNLADSYGVPANVLTSATWTQTLEVQSILQLRTTSRPGRARCGIARRAKAAGGGGRTARISPVARFAIRSARPSRTSRSDHHERPSSSTAGWATVGSITPNTSSNPARSAIPPSTPVRAHERHQHPDPAKLHPMPQQQAGPASPTTACRATATTTIPAAARSTAFSWTRAKDHRSQTGDRRAFRRHRNHSGKCCWPPEAPTSWTIRSKVGMRVRGTTQIFLKKRIGNSRIVVFKNRRVPRNEASV